MKIAHVINRFDCAFEYEEVQTARLQSNNGHIVRVFCSNISLKNGLSIKEAKKRKKLSDFYVVNKFLAIERMSCLVLYGDIMFSSSLENKILKFRPDIIHAHTILHGLAFQASLIAKKHRIPFLCDSHDFLFNGHPLQPIKINLFNILKYLEFFFLRKWISKKIITVAKFVISTNPAVTEMLKVFYQLNLKKIKIVNLAVDTEKFKPCKKMIPKAKDSLVVIPGLMTARKKPSEYLSILKNLKSKNVKFVFCGFENQKVLQNLKNNVTSMNLNKQVITFKTLNQRKLVELYTKSSLALLLFSGSISILECMACGLPILSGPNQMNYLLNPEFIINNKDSKLSAKLIDNLLKNKKLLFKQGQRNRMAVIQNSSAEARYKKLLSIYNLALSKKSNESEKKAVNIFS